MRKSLSRLRVFSLLMGLSLILAACGAATATETQSPVSTPAVGDAPEDADTVDIPEGAKEMTDLVQQDLAEYLGIAKDEVQVVSVTAMEWPDSSMGCPKPGMNYLDVITPGYRIVLTAAGQTYTYHTGPDGFVLCDQEGDDKDKEVTPEPGTEALVEEAKQDLSKHLNIAVEEIVLKASTSVEWRNSSLGCPQPGTAYLDVISPGYLIELEANGQIYSYHAGQEDSPFLCENPEPPLTRNDVEKRMLDAAKSDLAQRLEISTGAIEVVRVDPVQWPDASMGCPQPGMSYAQMVTSGYQIILVADGQEYDYRANYETAILCEQ